MQRETIEMGAGLIQAIFKIDPCHPQALAGFS
jgi:hypothetical protein